MIEDILREVVGKRLTSAGGTFHVYDDSVSTEALAVWLGFDESKALRFAGTSDGWHLVVDDAKPLDFDMQESGSIRFMDLANTPTVTRAMGERLRRAWLVLSPGPDDAIGVRLDFDTCTMRILNWGDTTYLAPGYPEDANASEITERPVQ